MASGAVPGSALAPVGPANASVERFLVPPPVAIPINFSTVFAPSAEERRQAASERDGDEVEQFLRFGSREVPRRLVDTIVRAADATGVDAIYLMALADKESSFRTDVKAKTSSAEGLFQFIDQTWLETVRAFGARHGLEREAAAITLVEDRPDVSDEAMRASILDLRRDPYLAALMAAELLKRDAEAIGLRIGRKLNRTEMYLAHFLGLEGAARFIALRETKRPPSAAKAFPAAARANAEIFFERKTRGRRGGRRGRSLSEVYARFDDMIDSRLERYRDVEVHAAAAKVKQADLSR